MATYFYSKTIKAGFEDAISAATEALKTQGFGIVSVIDLKEKFKEKLGVDYKKYTILGVCSPAFAYQALQLEEKIGVMLPCNVLVIDKENGLVEIAVVDPVASMKAVENSVLVDMAGEVGNKLRKAIDLV